MLYQIICRPTGGESRESSRAEQGVEPRPTKGPLSQASAAAQRGKNFSLTAQGEVRRSEDRFQRPRSRIDDRTMLRTHCGSLRAVFASAPCRDTSRTNSAAISSAASSASHLARARCTGCGQAFVVAFSCKGRGVCPSSSGRHMAQTAAHLADHVIPPVPVRQWVISVPKRLRGMLADWPPAVAADADMPRAARPRLGGISPATASARRSTTTCISTHA